MSCEQNNCNGEQMSCPVSVCHTPAMVCPPMQEWTDIYTPEEGLAMGTMFKALDLPFHPNCEGERGK